MPQTTPSPIDTAHHAANPIVDTVPQELRWAAYLRDLGLQLEASLDDSTRETVRGEVWRILRLSLSRFLRYHARRFGHVTPEDLEDVASQKSLELIHNLDIKKWSLTTPAVEELPRILSTVARNGLVDLLRDKGRLVRATQTHEQRTEATPAWSRHIASSPESDLDRKEFAQALRHCVAQLDDRSQEIWFFRIFYDMSSKEIAAHPDLSLRPGHVDVLLKRARQSVRNCMARAGHSPGDMPAGVFTVLWSTFRRQKSEERVSSL